MISKLQVADVAEQLQQLQPVSTAILESLRTGFPEIHFSYCMDDDVDTVDPVFEQTNFNLYLLDSSQHCLNLTQDFELASGFVVAEIDEI